MPVGPTKMLILDGNPDAGSLTSALARTAAETAREAGHDVRLIHLADLRFDPDLGPGYRGHKPVEPDLEDFIAALEACKVFVLIHPLWWGSAPAKLKGLFDRALLPGRAFRYVAGKALPEKLLAGRESRVLILSDTPPFFLRWLYGNGWSKALRGQILDFVGLKVRRMEVLAPVSGATPGRIAGFFDRAKAVVR